MIAILYGVIVLLAVLKLTGNIEISWLMVFSPFALALVIGIITAYQEVKLQKQMENMKVDLDRILKNLGDDDDDRGE